MKYKTLGLIGGIGPESTVEYYKNIIKIFRKKTVSAEYPNFLINSINMTEMLDYVSQGNTLGLVSFLAGEINKLEKAGAEFTALASNTPHIVFDELEKAVSIPCISIVKETVNEIQKQGFSKVGLFGTKFTMTGGFYQQTGKANFIDIVTPNNDEMDYIHSIYFGELVLGIIKQETKDKLLAIADRMKKDNGIQGLILGGTELPLILKHDDFKDVLLFDTSEIHIDSIVDYLLDINK